ncbi:MAG TPA: hypothetical protein VNQ90_10600 [Chthoniobacteraceae bacterium]|nr:hypothetical protein [Chthoniobacteraceae bacterium]
MFKYLAFILGLAISVGVAGAEEAQRAREAAAVPLVPQYTVLKDLHLQTDLVVKGRAAVIIVPPAGGRYAGEVRALRKALREATGVEIPVVEDAAVMKERFPEGNTILLGNRSTNRVISRLYDRFFALTDLRYPGTGGYEVRSIHDPFGDGHNHLLLGGSDDEGVRTAVARLIAILESRKGERDSFSLKPILDVKLSGDFSFTGAVNDAPTWQDSEGYKGNYFGWNSVSRAMALYYMTGEEKYAREFLRLAFPDPAAKAEIEKLDGERIETKDDPLAGPYHYNATRMMLYWDLIEESPLFSDEERLRVTNAFARQLAHRVEADGYTGDIHALEGPREAIGSRHGIYTALSLYVLARYFTRDYESPLWRKVLKASGEYYFAPLKRKVPLVEGENDNLHWYGTAVAPILDYILLSGDRRGIGSGAVSTLLRVQESIWNGTSADRNLRFVAVDYLNKAAYLTGDGRWIHYREMLPVSVKEGRLDQSFWPERRFEAVEPTDLARAWTISRPTPPARAAGENPSHGEWFRMMSYRSKVDGTGDFLLIKGRKGRSRNPFHVLAMTELRIDGTTLLKGYLNQVRLRSNGAVGPKLETEAVLKGDLAFGKSALAVAEVHQLPYGRWRRSVYLREGRLSLVVDRLKVLEDSSRFEAEFWWQGVMPWRQRGGNLRSKDAVVLNGDLLPSVTEGNRTRFLWNGTVRKGEQKDFFSLVLKADGRNAAASAQRLAVNAALFRTPGELLSFTGKFGEADAALGVVGEGFLFAQQLRSFPGIVTEDAMDLDWDFRTGEVFFHMQQPVTVTMKLAETASPVMDGKTLPFAGNKVSLSLPAGISRASGFVPSSASARFLANHAKQAVPEAEKGQAAVPHDVPQGLKAMPVVFDVRIKETIGQVVRAGEGETLCYYIAAGDHLYMMDARGRNLRQLATVDGPRMIHWWAEEGLLVAGTRDQRVVAYTGNGEVRWSFQSKMAEEVAKTGKTYWYNTAPGYEGIHGLDSGMFLEGKSQLFVGSACTLEIVDANGDVLKRVPQFWGTPAIFQRVEGPGGSINLLAARSITERDEPGVLNSRNPEPARRGFFEVPEGYSHVTGWIDQRRLHLLRADLDGDGQSEIISDITGLWNRISIWDETGLPKATINFGPGPSPYRGHGRIVPALIRDTAVGPVESSGKRGIVTVLSSGLVLKLDPQCRTEWSRRLAGVPTRLGVAGERIVVGDERGTVTVLDGKGNFLRKTKAAGAVNAIVKASDDAVMVVSDHAIQQLALPSTEMEKNE